MSNNLNRIYAYRERNRINIFKFKFKIDKGKII